MRISRYSPIVLAALCLAVAPIMDAQWAGTDPLTTSSNVGIGPGAAAPLSLLHIAGTNGVNAITLDTPGTQNFRFQSIPSIQDWGALTLNSNYTGGSGWFLDNTAQNGWFFKIDGRQAGGPNAANEFNGLWLYRIPSGAGAHTNEYATFGVTNGYTYMRDKVLITTGGPAVPDSALHVVGTAHITGNVTVDGNLAAKYQDIAEWVPTQESLAPGTVVVLNLERDNEVLASTRPYDTTVAGVVSEEPGIILGVASGNKARIATTGRVKVRAFAGDKGIKIGDLLVSGDRPGTAIRSEPMEINGRMFHQPGTVIGKALQALPEGEGEILVLLSLQ
jgi:hypothetical protein